MTDTLSHYKGNPNLGEYGAFNQFLSENKNIKIREFFKYGYSGISFVVYDI